MQPSAVRLQFYWYHHSSLCLWFFHFITFHSFYYAVNHFPHVRSFLIFPYLIQYFNYIHRMNVNFPLNCYFQIWFLIVLFGICIQLRPRMWNESGKLFFLESYAIRSPPSSTSTKNVLSRSLLHWLLMRKICQKSNKFEWFSLFPLSAYLTLRFRNRWNKWYQYFYKLVGCYADNTVLQSVRCSLFVHSLCIKIQYYLWNANSTEKKLIQ